MDVSDALGHVATQGSHLVGEGRGGFPNSQFGGLALLFNDLDGALEQGPVGCHLGGGLEHGLAVAASVLGPLQQALLDGFSSGLDPLSSLLRGLPLSQLQGRRGSLNGLGHLQDLANDAAGVDANTSVGSHNVFLAIRGIV